MATSRNLLCLLLLALSGHCSSETLVPFIAWSNGNALNGFSSKQPSTVEEFAKGAKLNDVEFLIVFKASKLSFDDIAKFGGVYGEEHSSLASLQSSLQSAESTLWAGMHGQVASSLVSTLSFNYEITPNNIIGAEDIVIGHTGKQLYVILLPEDGNEEREFLEQDKVFSQVMAVVTKSNKPYVAFYTADHSAQSEPQMQVFEAKREAQTDDIVNFDYLNDFNANTTYGGTVCARMSMGNDTTQADTGRCPMLCLTPPFYLLERENNTNHHHGSAYNIIDHADTIRIINGSCLSGNDTGKCRGEKAPFFYVEAQFNNSEPVIFLFMFKQGVQGSGDNCTVPRGFWTIDIEVEGERYERYTRSRLFTKFEVPIGASYACGNNSHNIFVHRNTSTGYKFSAIQAQVGGKFSQTSFGSAYNCESYLSHVSLMGVFSVLILLIVLYCSTVFMFQMKTMDRFDDPRGPTITVENLH